MSVRSHRFARGVALGALVLWGAIHVVGGLAEIATAEGDGGEAALELLGSAADAQDIPGDPGAVAEAVIGFHGFLIASAGLAVAALAVGNARGGRPPTLISALTIVAVADLGLIVFLVLPGYISLAEAIWGPLLLVVAFVGAFRSDSLSVDRREAESTTEPRGAESEHSRPR